jgi:hypothetical protein
MESPKAIPQGEGERERTESTCQTTSSACRVSFVMEVVFTRINSHKYSSVATRDDGVSLAIPGFGPSKPVPHDMIHFVVEDELAVDYGFWGCVAAGAIYKGMAIVGGKVRHDNEKKSQEIIRKVGQKISEAECLAGIILKILREQIENDWPRIQELQKSAWQPTHPARAKMTRDEIKRICRRIHALAQDWKALPDGQTLTLHWNAKKPRKSVYLTQTFS